MLVKHPLHKGWREVVELHFVLREATRHEKKSLDRAGGSIGVTISKELLFWHKIKMANLVEVPLLFSRVRSGAGQKFLKDCSENGRRPRLRYATYLTVHRRWERLATRRVSGNGSHAYRKLSSSSRFGLLPAEFLWMELNEALGQRVRKGQIDSIRLVEQVSAQQWSAWGRNRNKESSLRLQKNERLPQGAGRRPDRLRERLRRSGDDGGGRQQTKARRTL